MNKSYFFTLVLIVISMLSSCKGKSLAFYDYDYFGGPFTNAGPWMYTPVYTSPSFSRGPSMDDVIFRGETLSVYKCKEKIFLGENVQENTEKLTKIVNSLQQRLNERVSFRADFLQGFYADLYKLNSETFADKYKRHCSRELLKRMKNLYREMHGMGKKDYAWVIFGDNKVHQDEKFPISFLNAQWDKFDRQQADFMYASWEKNRITRYEYPYYNQEDNWYEVRLNDKPVYIRVEGVDKKHVAITGVVNPILNVWIKTQYDR